MMSRILPIPLSIAAVLLTGGPLAAAPDYPAAIAEQQQRLAAAPTAAAWNDLGALLLLTDDRADAGRAFEQALELEAENPAALYNLGVLVLESDPNRSRKLLRSALEGREDGWTHYRLAQAFERLHRERRAIRHYARAFALDRTLLYPDVNPEIIGNRFATESLLAVADYTSDVRMSPRFVEPVAVRDLLLGDRAGVPGEAIEAVEGEGVPEALGEEGDGSDGGDEGDG